MKARDYFGIDSKKHFPELDCDGDFLIIRNDVDLQNFMKHDSDRTRDMFPEEYPFLLNAAIGEEGWMWFKPLLINDLKSLIVKMST